MSGSITWDKWDEKEQRWRYFFSERNPVTGIYDQNTVETDEIGLELE